VKILVAEDDRLTREGLLEILAREGYRPIGAADGEEALRLFRQERPDFVCLDIMMPGLSGYEVCRRLRAEAPALPIIFISAKSEEIDRVVGLELGADDFIQKPFGVREVVARIRAVTRRYLAGRRPEEGDQPFPWATWRCVRPSCGPGGGARPSTSACAMSASCAPCTGCAVGWWTATPSPMPAGATTISPAAAASISRYPNCASASRRDPRNPEIIRTVHGIGYRFEGE
jgi:DNA-binding response OmpR family regulator